MEYEKKVDKILSKLPPMKTGIVPVETYVPRGISSINNFMGAVTIVGGTNVSVSSAGNIITIDSIGAVSSISNSDGTLTVSQPTGAVGISLALSHSNIWTAKQTINVPTASSKGLVVSTTDNSATNNLVEYTNSTGTQKVYYFHDGSRMRWGLTDGTVTANAYAAGANFTFTTETNHGITFVTNTSTRFIITKDGDVAVSGSPAPTAKFHVFGTDTANEVCILTAPQAQVSPIFQLHQRTSTDADRELVDLDAAWVTATDATRKGRFIGRVWDTAAREFMRGEASGSAAMIGFLGAAAVARTSAYTPTNVTTDRSYDANATTVDELADVLGTLIADLQAFGLLG